MKKFYTLLCVVSFSMMPAYGYADNSTIVFVHPIETTVSNTTYAVTLINLEQQPLNVMEFSLYFPATSRILERNLEGALCRSELVVEDRFNSIENNWYAACGNYIPFRGLITRLGTFSIENTTEHTFRFGTNTSLYRHDGLGTRLQPRMFGVTNQVIEV